MQSTDLQVIKEIPGYKVILKTVLKSQIQQLVEQLADHTGEESVILTASVSDGSLSHLGSEAGKVFLEDHDDIKSQFLGFCLKHHHKQKQLEKEKEEREKQQQQQQQQLQDPGGQMLMAPTTPTRFGPGPRPRFSPSRIHTSPRQFSPRGVHPISLTRASPRGGAPGVRHEPYPGARPRKPLNFDPSRRPQTSSSMRLPTDPGSAQKINTKLNEVIKIEAMDEDEENAEKSRTEERKSSVDLGQGESGPGTEPNTNTTAAGIPPTPTNSIHSPAIRDDGSENSSSSTITNEPAEVKYSDTLPPGGLSLDSDLSNLMGVPSDTAKSDTSTSDSAAIDPNVSVKLEAIADSDDLEITGVEPGQMAQPDYGMMPDLQSMGYSPSTSGGAQGGMGDQSSQGYSTYLGKQGDYACTMHSCLFCGKVFEKQHQIVRHVRIHTGEKPWSCDICMRRFTTNHSLNQHQIKHMNVSNQKTTIAEVNAPDSKKRGPNTKDANKSDLFETDQIKTDQIKTDQINTDQIKTDQIKTDQIKMYQIKTKLDANKAKCFITDSDFGGVGQTKTMSDTNKTKQTTTISDMSYAEQTRIKSEEEQALVDLLNL